jgi:hypothetical protein
MRIGFFELDPRYIRFIQDFEVPRKLGFPAIQQQVLILYRFAQSWRLR